MFCWHWEVSGEGGVLGLLSGPCPLLFPLCTLSSFFSSFSVLAQTTSSITINYIISRLLNRDSLRVRSRTVGSSIRANQLPTHPTYHLLASNGNLDKAVAVHLFMVTKGTKHGLCTLSKVEKGASPS